MVKALLGYGARMPKELMLFAKNMVFVDAAIANLAPEVDSVRRDHPPGHLLRHHARSEESPPTLA